MSRVDSIFNQAISALNGQHLAEAEKGFRRAVELDPLHIPALNLLAIVLMNSGRFAEAEPFIAKAVSLNGSSDVSFYNYGLIAKQLKKPQLAYEQFTNALNLNPLVAETWNNRGTVCNDMKNYGAAVFDFDKAIQLNRHYAEAYANKGKSLTLLKRHDEALAAYEAALAMRPDLAEAWLGRGYLLARLGRPDEALAAYDNALANKPGFQEACISRGNVLSRLRRPEEALAAYDKALTIDPRSEDAWVGRGDVLNDLKRYGEAFAAYDKALALNPNSAQALLGRGNAFFHLRRFDDAIAAYDAALSIDAQLEGSWVGRGNILTAVNRPIEALDAFDKAILLNPILADAWLGRGNALFYLKRYDNAFSAYEKAIAINPDLAEAWLGRGNVLTYLKRFDEAFAAYDNAFRAKPELVGVEGARLHTKMQLCSWENLADEIDHVLGSIRRDAAKVNPFVLIPATGSAADSLKCACNWTSSECPEAPDPVFRRSPYVHDKIRIGYVSADFNEHATSHLMAEVFELHDRSRFSINAFSIGPDDGSEIRTRLCKAFDAFVDCQSISDLQVARAIKEHEIDLLIDLKGFTQHARTKIFAHRPAPIQVNYCGYPGTMGAPYIDYIIGDRVLFNPGDERVYSEKLVRLPHSYQPNDRKRQISDRVFTRQEFLLPAGAFVFCCFNSCYKILPQVFDRWMRILSRVEGSVLWLLEESRTATDNLKQYAASKGVGSDRLVFAKRVEVSEHLARHSLADLFLDTLPCNAHTTASDALWAGLPMITQYGGSFAGRVAASLLSAVDLHELITHSLDEYESLAVDLAGDPERLEKLRSRLREGRATAPLFNTPRYVRNLECAYEHMCGRYRTGLSPDHIDVAPDHE